MRCPICGGHILRDGQREDWQCLLCGRVVEWDADGVIHLVATPPAPAIVREKPFRRGPILGGERVRDRGPQ